MRASVLCRLKVWSAPLKAKNKIAGEKKSPMYRCSSRIDFSLMPRFRGLALSVPGSDDSRLLSAASDIEDSIVPIAFMWLLFVHLLDNCGIGVGMPYRVGPGLECCRMFPAHWVFRSLAIAPENCIQLLSRNIVWLFPIALLIPWPANSADTPNTKS